MFQYCSYISIPIKCASDYCKQQLHQCCLVSPCGIYILNRQVQVKINAHTSARLGEQLLFWYYVYRVTCNSTRSSTSLQTPDGTVFNLIFSSLYPYTNYTCCVETFYTDMSENAFACAMNTTFEGGMYILLVYKIYTMMSDIIPITCIMQYLDLRLLWSLSHLYRTVLRQYWGGAHLLQMSGMVMI